MKHNVQKQKIMHYNMGPPASNRQQRYRYGEKVCIIELTYHLQRHVYSLGAPRSLHTYISAAVRPYASTGLKLSSLNLLNQP